MALARASRCGLASLLAGLCLLPPARADGQPGMQKYVPGAYMTSETETRTFAWGKPARTVKEALADAFPGGNDSWVDISFTDGGVTVTESLLVTWVEQELLGGKSPFEAHGGKVPVPWPTMAGLEDQIRPGQWASYSRRQVCYIVAQSLVGAGTEGYANGLVRYLEKVSNGGCQARRSAFGRAYFVLLAACAADPTLRDGGQGPLLVAAKATAPAEVEAVRAASRKAKMRQAGLRVCQYDDGVGERLDLPEGVKAVPKEGCAPPTADMPGRDFMTGGLEGQAVQDISARFLGGYVFGYDCGLGGGQDERLMTYMPEVGALTFFLSQSTYKGGDEHPHPQLRQPAWILGARQLFIGLDGTGRFTALLKRDPSAPLTSDLADVELLGKKYSISSSRPFLAFMSENQGFIPEGPGTNDTRLARQNLHLAQRNANASTGMAFANQVRAWYSSVALTSYSLDVRPMLRSLVKSLGTGPWLAGLWWGDSQLGLLAVWMGHALAAPSWNLKGTKQGEGESESKKSDLPLDYYLYSAFTENPGNQCLLHSKEKCGACLNHCKAKPLPKSAYWLPDWAFFGDKEDHASSCTPATAPCGAHGLQHVLAAYAQGRVEQLWSDVERALEASVRAGSAGTSVFDMLLAGGRRLLV